MQFSQDQYACMHECNTTVILFCPPYIYFRSAIEATVNHCILYGIVLYYIVTNQLLESIDKAEEVVLSSERKIYSRGGELGTYVDRETINDLCMAKDN